ncbi:class I SAM-dependent methyltransferase, partial [Chloroflexota bacterium]
KRLLKYTRRAFRMLPQLDKPRILDIGCGSGVPTLELARLTGGEITGLDSDQGVIDILSGKIEKAGLSDRVKALKCSVFDMDFPPQSFDVIWAEGSISVVGFQEGLQEWRRYLKPGGFIAIHDEKGIIQRKLAQVSGCGYQLLGYFILNEDTWWTEYFAPIEKLIYETRTKYRDNPGVLKALHDAQWEVNVFKKDPTQNTSAFFVMRHKQRPQIGQAKRFGD